MNDEQLSSLIQRHGERHTASPNLRAAVQTQLTLHQATQRSSQALPIRWGGVGRLVHGFRWPVLGLAGGRGLAGLSLSFVAGVLLTLALVSGLPHGLHVGPAHTGLGTELLNLHVHSMGVGPLFQIASSDRHTVKPWFQGKLDYAPQVADLRNDGFELLGGRIDRVQGHDTAVMAYEAHKHIISAWVLPAERAIALEALQQRGFNVVHWSDGTMEVWALSDIDAAELQRFAAIWRAKFATTKS